uniref:Uncharacterized protein n=1 Tax=Arundo donax TaxID=35708 RepID=A0A0A9HE44_ARUDO
MCLYVGEGMDHEVTKERKLLLKLVEWTLRNFRQSANWE